MTNNTMYIRGKVTDRGRIPIVGALVKAAPPNTIAQVGQEASRAADPCTYTDENGCYQIAVTQAGEYGLTAHAFGESSDSLGVQVPGADESEGVVASDLVVKVLSSCKVTHTDSDSKSPIFYEGEFASLEARVESVGKDVALNYEWSVGGVPLPLTDTKQDKVERLDTTGYRDLLPIAVRIWVAPATPNGETPQRSAPESQTWVVVGTKISVTRRPLAAGDALHVSMQRTGGRFTADVPLWELIRKSSEALSFGNYERFIGLVLCGKESETGIGRVTAGKLLSTRCLPYSDMEAYRLLKVATEAFMMVSYGTPPVTGELKDVTFDQRDLDQVAGRLDLDPGAPSAFQTKWTEYLSSVSDIGGGARTLPYLAVVYGKIKELGLKTKIFDVDVQEPFGCYGILTDKLTRPCLIELIWSYWHECGMLVQTLNAISLRFQNRTSGMGTDPLANFETDTLRPLNNLLWGYVRDEQHRLTLAQRVYEYSHQYGLTFQGKAVPRLRPADHRSKFLETFHNLLHLCTRFYRQDDDTTVISDGFPVLNALRDVHRVLSEGAHNQYGDLPSTARQEMLMQQWLLARPEMREFLPTRISVVYPEPWMDRVDAMKRMQGWMDTSISQFRELAVFGEQILLSIRFGNWSDVTDREQAKNWARYWRSEVQGYIHAYKAVTGADLTSDRVDTTLPSIHLERRLRQQVATAR